MSPILQTGITLLVVGLAAGYLGRNLLRQLKGRNNGGCDGCSGSKPHPEAETTPSERPRAQR
jgi:hypothetical protein